ncbi:hypothetical protein LIN78_07995 [Leeia sp. TBRC 13508]|uniref:Lipoprotein n=1 Tax=Leeia speluncae TaxID=2884804 RepID=A0ABS8D5N2_9NEIS|nr:hypothetical protein [Leeia speluncae]MCB6183487.1 hypothetical protein [Leeia speluncae]
MNFAKMACLATTSFALLSACTLQKATDTGRWFSQQNGLSLDRNVEALSPNHWRFTVFTSTLGLTSNLKFAVEEVTQPYCSGKTPKVVFDELSEGIHNAVTGGQRYAKGKFHCE